MILVPIRTTPGMNVRDKHWGARSRRVKAERAHAAIALMHHTPPPLPCRVVLTRIAPSRGLDDDNLAGALKGVRDQVAQWIGVDDRDRMIVRYSYEQERGPWGVRITFQDWPR